MKCEGDLFGVELQDRKDCWPKVLLATSQKNFNPWRDHPNIGLLLTPHGFTYDTIHPYTAADNRAYSNWNARRFVSMLERFHPGQIKWVCCPDVVGDWKTTLMKWEAWSEVVSLYGFRLAYVAQDGQPVNQVPWQHIECLFVGGTDAFKLSQDAIQLCRVAKHKGKHVHVGRVNSFARVKKFLPFIDSFDGLTYSKFGKTHLPRLLKELERC